jgi:chorismate-pyruvate lyase
MLTTGDPGKDEAGQAARLDDQAGTQVQDETAAEPCWDPSSPSFLSEFLRRSSLQPINLRVLTPYQRALLVLDGTVTSFIQSWSMDPVQILCLGQTVRALSQDHADLCAPAGTEVLARSVILEGKHSCRFHAYALSLVVVDRLPAALRQALEGKRAGIGEIIGGHAMETRREILWSGREQISQLPPEVRRRWAGEFIVRTYRIHAEGKPIMLISERFPFTKAEPPVYD